MTDAGIEKAARAIYEIDFPPGPHMPSWDDATINERRDYTAKARAAVIAYLEHAEVTRQMTNAVWDKARYAIDAERAADIFKAMRSSELDAIRRG